MQRVVRLMEVEVVYHPQAWCRAWHLRLISGLLVWKGFRQEGCSPGEITLTIDQGCSFVCLLIIDAFIVVENL